VIWLGGGAKKDVSLDELRQTIPQYCKKVVLLSGTGTDELLKHSTEPSPSNRTIEGVPVLVVDSLAEAVKTALADSQPGDVLLFSPGFASFGLFKNEYERNDQFLTIINSLTAT
jgi:UDP-N-acetylmuramoylalanine--D-glutamate ligase